MIYRPGSEYSLWDTWLFAHDGIYHLFYLNTHIDSGTCTIGHATSSDLLDWKAEEPINVPRSNRSPALLTGMVIQHDGQFYMFYGDTPDNDLTQQVSVVVSDDLYHWEKVSDRPVLCAEGPYYQSTPEQSSFGSIDWRDPCVVWVEHQQRYEVFLCARRNNIEPGIDACIARAWSKDLLHWNILPPAYAADFVSHAEVPDVFQMGDFHYLLLSDHTKGGAWKDTHTREKTGGTYCLMSDKYGEGYALSQEPLLIGSGCGGFTCYVGRTIPHNQGRLLYHHMCGPRPALGIPKLMRQEPDGTLVLDYWTKVDKLATKVVRQGWGKDLQSYTPLGKGEWQVSNDSLQGSYRLLGTGLLLPEKEHNFILECRVTIQQGRRAGLLVKFSLEGSAVGHEDCAHGMGVIVDQQHSRISVGPVLATWHGGLNPDVWDWCKWPLEPGKSVRLRVIVRAEFMEVYVDDRWVLSTVLSSIPALNDTAGNHDGIGFLVHDASACFEDLKLSLLPPLP